LQWEPWEQHQEADQLDIENKVTVERWSDDGIRVSNKYLVILQMGDCGKFALDVSRIFNQRDRGYESTMLFMEMDLYPKKDAWLNDTMNFVIFSMDCTKHAKF
jgi:hypothetical protein